MAVPKPMKHFVESIKAGSARSAPDTIIDRQHPSSESEVGRANNTSLRANAAIVIWRRWFCQTPIPI
jgi:hypothetical protein